MFPTLSLATLAERCPSSIVPLMFAAATEPALPAVAAALRYVRKRKQKMRYASLYEANLPIGSGATESTCWQMQRRVQRPGQSWEVPGLRGILAVRSLVLSERWNEAWKPYAARQRKEVHCVN